MSVTALERLETKTARTAEPNIAGFDKVGAVIDELQLFRMFRNHVPF